MRTIHKEIIYVGTIVVIDEHVKCETKEGVELCSPFDLAHNEVPMHEVRTLVRKAITAHVNK
jgi:hypothetical protein